MGPHHWATNRIGVGPLGSWAHNTGPGIKFGPRNKISWAHLELGPKTGQEKILQAQITGLGIKTGPFRSWADTSGPQLQIRPILNLGQYDSAGKVNPWETRDAGPVKKKRSPLKR